MSLLISNFMVWMRDRDCRLSGSNFIYNFPMAKIVSDLQHRVVKDVRGSDVPKTLNFIKIVKFRTRWESFCVVSTIVDATRSTIRSHVSVRDPSCEYINQKVFDTWHIFHISIPSHPLARASRSDLGPVLLPRHQQSSPSTRLEGLDSRC